jgi:hypothetical protein
MCGKLNLVPSGTNSREVEGEAAPIIGPLVSGFSPRKNSSESQEWKVERQSEREFKTPFLPQAIFFHLRSEQQQSGVPF